MPISPPVPGDISSSFRDPRPTKKNPKRIHNGVDYNFDNSGTPTNASLGGIVVRSTYHEPREMTLTFRWNDNVRTEKKFTGSYGNVVIIYHGVDVWSRMHTYTLYAHLKKKSKNKLDIVKQGQKIGTIGRTGTRQGSYGMKGGYKLHFEVLQSKEMLDWVSSGHLDFRCTSETWRIDPKDFLNRRSAKGFAMRDRKVFIVNMPNGETIIHGKALVEHRDKNGVPIKTVLRTDHTDSAARATIAKLFAALGIGIGIVGTVSGPGSPLTVDDLTEEIDRAYDHLDKVINPEDINRKGLSSSNPFAKALRRYDNPKPGK